MNISNHQFSGANVRQAPTNNHGGMLLGPRFVVMHFTAGRSAESSVDWFRNPQAKASAHVVVGRNGNVTQLVPFNTVAWHAGVSAWDGINGLNSCSIGVELDNMGELTKSGDRYFSWFKTEVTADDVVHAAHKADGVPSYWQDYTAPQMDATIELVSLLCQTYSIEDILGHEDIAPGRKRDPGPAFPMRSFKARVLGRQQDILPRYRVTADRLNIRGGPGAMFPTIAPPLAQSAVLLVEEQQSQWSKATVEAQPAVRGWVSNAYITAA